MHSSQLEPIGFTSADPVTLAQSHLHELDGGVEPRLGWSMGFLQCKHVVYFEEWSGTVPYPGGPGRFTTRRPPAERELVITHWVAVIIFAFHDNAFLLDPASSAMGLTIRIHRAALRARSFSPARWPCGH